MATTLAHRVCSVWWFLLWVLPLVATTNALSIPLSEDIQLRFLPLIGGPPFLPVHCRVVLYKNYGFDFVPVNPTSKDTLQRLLKLQAVPGDARIFLPPPPQEEGAASSIPIMVTRAKDFCTNYTKDLHLIQNNCWLFAYELIDYIIIQQREDEGGEIL